MWFVFCELNDTSALWAYEGLKKLGLDPLEVVSSEALSCSLHWEHWLGSNGFGVKITLGDGRIIDSSRIKGVLNRLSFVHTDHMYLVRQEDQDYALQELNALFQSWLNALPCPVLNRPSPYGLSGQWRHDSEWSLLAAKAGLITRPYVQTSDPGQLSVLGVKEEKLEPTTNVLVVNEHVVGENIPTNVAKGCKLLSELSKTALLGIEFDLRPTGDWVFMKATPSPNLLNGGQTFLEALATSMRDGANNTT